jgi:hypothetical protein
LSLKWKGVRPLRTRADVFDVLDKISLSKSSDIETVRLALVEQRDKRENKRLNIYRLKRSVSDKRRKREGFLTKAEQVMKVLRRIQLVNKDGNRFLLTERGEQILDYYRKEDRKSDSLFLESLINSEFLTYWLFLKQLHRHPVSIPQQRWTRDSLLRDFLWKQGFPIDVWSFFILRDLYYEFGLLNYGLDRSSSNAVEKTIPMFELAGSDASLPKFALHFHSPEGAVHYWPQVSITDFLQMLSQTYLSMTDGNWNRIVELLLLREEFSMKCLIPEAEFNELFTLSLREEAGDVRLIPSVGYVRQRLRGGMTKAVNLPSNSQGLPLTLVRIEPRN